MAIGVFGLKKVYKKQLENISNENFNSWVEDYSHGYVIAGRELGASEVSNIVRYSYETDVSIDLPSGSSIPAAQGKTANAVAFNYNYGYVGGGTNPNGSIISRLDFSLDTFSVPGTNLPTNVSGHTELSRVNEGYGYFIGGQNSALAPPQNISTITRLDFANETLSPMPNLPASLTRLGSFDGTTYGYVGGGSNPTPTNVNTIYRLDFSNNTLSITPSSRNFITISKNYIPLKSPLYGYAAAGSNTSTSDTSVIERLDFSSETVSTLSALTSASGDSGAGFYSLIGGYMMGINSTTNLTRLDFSTELVSSPIAFGSINKSRENFSSASARHKRYNNNTGTYQYCNRGNNGGDIDRLSFQTGTWSGPVGKPSSDDQRQIKGASSNEYGYFFGGQLGSGQTSLISKLDFTVELLTTTGRTKGLSLTLPSGSSLTRNTTTQTNSYAYIAGGANPDTSAILRMDFSTESITREASFPANRKAMAATKSATNAYFAFGNNSNVYRFDFSAETVSSLPNYPFAHNGGGQTASAKGNTYGYFIGGQNPASSPNRSSSVYRFDFSSETFNLIPTTLSTENDGGGYSYNNLYSYFNCFVSDSAVSRMDFGTETITAEAPAPGSSKKNSAAYTNANN